MFSFWTAGASPATGGTPVIFPSASTITAKKDYRLRPVAGEPSI